MRPEFQDIVDEASRLLSRPATLEDRDFNLVAFCSHDAEVDEVRLHSILQRHSTREVQDWFESFGIATTDAPVRTPTSPDLEVLSRLCVPARWHGVTYGYLWLLDDEAEIDPSRVPAAAVLAERAGALMAQQARAREQLEFKLHDLLSTDPEAVDRAAHDIHELGIIERQVPVAVVELRTQAPGATQPVPMNLWRLPRSVLAASTAERTTLLVPAGATDLEPVLEIAREAWDMYAERLDPGDRAGLVAGVGGARADLSQARASWQEARLAARVGRVVPAVRPIAVWPELGVYRLLACGPERALSGAVLDPAVVRLIEHGDADLRRTASAFLAAGGSVQETAAELNVHRQTVYYRVTRIEQVTGLDLSRGDDRLLLHLGLTLAPLLHAPMDGTA
jgi:sugar diacid utilization regulator